MAVKILIRRKFKDVDKKIITAMLIKARSNAMGRKGYISSETLVSYDNPRLYLMLSMWQKKEDWDSYRKSSVRQDLERDSAALLDGETEYEVFSMGM